MRTVGNIAAHPEQKRELPGPAEEVAVRVLEILYGAVTHWFGSDTRRAPFVAPVREDFERLCADAVLRKDRDAARLLGLREIELAKDVVKNHGPATLENRKWFAIKHRRAEAVRWLEEALREYDLLTGGDPSYEGNAWKWDYDGNLDAAFELGVFLCQRHEGFDPDRGQELIRVAADNDHPAACALVGQCYVNGRAKVEDFELPPYPNFETEKDFHYGRARECFEVAAAQDHPDGLLGLGRIYLLGLGVEKDENRAIGFILRAALDYPDSFAEFDAVYKHIGVGSFRLFEIAAEHAQKGERAAQNLAARLMQLLPDLRVSLDGAPSWLVQAIRELEPIHEG